jgi:hypothetical protein
MARWTAALFGLLWLLVLLGIVSIFMDILPETGAPRIIYETVPLMNILLSLSYVLGGLALAILIFAVLAWVRRYWSLGERVRAALTAQLQAQGWDVYFRR